MLDSAAAAAGDEKRKSNASNRRTAAPNQNDRVCRSELILTKANRQNFEQEVDTNWDYAQSMHKSGWIILKK